MTSIDPLEVEVIRRYYVKNNFLQNLTENILNTFSWHKFYLNAIWTSGKLVAFTAWLSAEFDCFLSRGSQIHCMGDKPSLGNTGQVLLRYKENDEEVTKWYLQGWDHPIQVLWNHPHLPGWVASTTWHLSVDFMPTLHYFCLLSFPMPFC